MTNSFFKSLINSKVTRTGTEAFFKSRSFFVPTMVMNYDTYLEIDQDSDSGIPGKPVWTHKERRHDEKIPSQKIRLTVDRALKNIHQTWSVSWSRPCTTMRRSRDNPVIASSKWAGGREVTAHGWSNFLVLPTYVKLLVCFFAKGFFDHDAVSYTFGREGPGIQNRNPGQFLSRYHSS